MKKIVTMTLAAAVVLGGSLAINHGYAQEDSQKASQAKELIGIEKAKEAALAKVKGTVESVELEKDFSKTYYEVDIDQDQKDFDIDVDAYTAEILKVDENRDDDDDDDELQAAAATDIISEKEAIEIAKKHVTGEVVEISLDEDDGRYEYDLELKTKDGKAELTIDAVTEKVTELEIDDNDDDGDDD
ncbi:PepSY domain-containing protein [Metabacillus sp. Hm71]|uniref:PepSY domain-containing protein n=1 Tax=Metabacillus sp. Hm71 TaxID=3450743 RepID=UPI003F420BE0